MNSFQQFRLAARHYLLGFFSAAWNGGIGALAGILGVDGASISGISTEARLLNWHEMAAAFVGAFVLNGIFWLKAHPLPENFDTSAPFFPAPKNPGAQPPSLPNQ